MTAVPPRSDKRREDARFVTGRGRYIADMFDDTTLHAAFVRSPEAHAVITSVDLDDVRSSPGVVAAWDAADLDLPEQSGSSPFLTVEGMDRPALARSRVRYVGEAVAVVVAETERQAVDAASLAWVDFDPLPVVADADAALTDATVLHDAAGTNIVEQVAVGADLDSQQYDVTIDVTVENGRLGPVSIEPLGVIAEPRADGGVEVWVSGQGAHRVQRPLAKMLDVPADVHIPDVGGAFGMKGPFYPEYGVVAACALRLGRRVGWVQTRREHLLNGTHGRGLRHRVVLAGDADGRIRWAYIQMLSEIGSYPSQGAQVPTFSRRVAAGLYDLPNLRVESTTVVTNRAPTGPYRGAGRPEAAFAIERAIDAFAVEAGLDPVEVRLANYITTLPHRTVTDALYDSGDYPAILRKAVDLIDLQQVRAEQQERLAAGMDPIGVGFGTFVERAGGPVDGGEYGRVEVLEDGTAVAYTGSVSAGQGHETVWARLASDALGLPYENVRVEGGDTALMPRSSGSSASRSTQLGGSAIHRTATAIRERAKVIAAEMMEAAVDDVVVADGVFSVAGVPGSGVTYAEVAALASRRDEPLTEDEWFSPGAQTFPYGAHAAVVEVEMETGFVKLRRIVAVDDCGNIINPMIVEGQLHGSLMQGIGQALYEGIVYDGEGQLKTATLMDYQMPRAGDQPSFTLDRLIHPAPSNPLGAKGTGEAGCIGAPPAIVNATLDALRPYGVTHLDMPLRPSTVWEALRDARASR